MQLAAAAAAVGVQRFKKLHRSGHHNRCIPVFAGHQLAVLCRGQVFPLKAFVICAGVIRQNVFCAQKVCKNSGSLVNDGHIRNHIDHPLHALRSGLFQRKGKGGKGFAAAGGHGEGIQPRCAVGTFLHASPQHGIACKVTLRGERMYEFLDRLVNLALPRVRDFRGVSADSFDGRGNYALGIKEQIIFPEIEYDKIDKVRGMDVIVVTTAKTDEEARELLRFFNMPFKK